ncbi:MAG TPA: DCC1-like thiol-disulfide oxidoreductase family protein, partial [Candidatus Thalassarchaeaceae archaeon]|nr:DCC1-like thiol-disulfide oxidoreductase family protein [Candidatus Thalassarchaeaceae archaeon]
RFLIIAQETEEGEVLMREMPEELRGIDSVVFIDEKGNWFVRSAAIIRILYRLRFPWMLFSTIWIVPYPLRDWLYDVYSRNRTRTV